MVWILTPSFYYLPAKSCGHPQQVPNAAVLDQEYFYMDTALYTCESGYALLGGNGEMTCGPDGTFTGSVPVCEGNAVEFRIEMSNFLAIYDFKQQKWPLDCYTLVFSTVKGFP